jgi:homotetrameric cytidine deaminase
MLTPLTETEITKLIDAARKAREHAFVHRSNHAIGASVLTESGDVYGGCNIESFISGLGTCAERCAINNAIANGHHSFRAVCDIDKGMTPCCGACLQYAMMFSQVVEHDLYIVNANLEGEYEIHLLSELLPAGYRTKNNLDELHSYQD